MTEKLIRFSLDSIGTIDAQLDYVIKHSNSEYFEPKRLIIEEEIAKNFIIKEIRLDNQPLLIGNVSALVYTPPSIVPPFRAVVGKNIYLAIKNKSNYKEKFKATVVGLKRMIENG